MISNLTDSIYNIEIERQGAEPVWQQLRNGLTSIVVSKDIGPGTRLPSLRKIGNQLSISYITVGKAVDQLVKEGLLETREGSGIYTTENSSKTIRSAGVLIGCLDSYMFSQFLKGMDNSFREKKIAMCIQPDFTLTGSQDFLEKVVVDNSVSGLIIYSEHTYKNQLLMDRVVSQLPVVILNSCKEVSADGLVYSDDDSGMSKVVKVLIEKQHKDVVMFSSNPDSSIFHYRRWGFEKHAKKAGLNFSIIDNVIDEEAAYLNTMRLVFEKKKFTAVVCASDVIAAGVLRFLNSNNIKVPDDIAVIGYGNLDFAGKLFPRLTTVEQHFETMGKEAVELLCRAAEKRSYGNPVRVKTETKLIIRETL